MNFDPDDPRLTAYALGELPAPEAHEFDQWIDQDAEARKAVDEIRQTARWLATELHQEQDPVPALREAYHGLADACGKERTRPVIGIVGETFLWIGGRPARNETDRALILPIVVGTIPGVLAGLLLLKRMAAFRTPVSIAVAMLAASAFFVLEGRNLRTLGAKVKTTVG